GSGVNFEEFGVNIINGEKIEEVSKILHSKSLTRKITQTNIYYQKQGLAFFVKLKSKKGEAKLHFVVVNNRGEASVDAKRSYTGDEMLYEELLQYFEDITR